MQDRQLPVFCITQPQTSVSDRAVSRKTDEVAKPRVAFVAFRLRRNSDPLLFVA